ncbi:YdcF family protein [Polaromonas jejuensis]|uniref:YdcF family protein n=1 Tax=Polaromonas jejuensis TaxID=457502 RepID=A0ABW0Q7T2_9BURK|nr:YdcF family protein [Polaromonas jejuensis]
MEFGALKPLLTVLVMPPTAPLLLALLGVLLAVRKKRAGLLLTTLSLLLLGLLSCHGTAVWLARHALPQFPPLSAVALKTGKVQAIVVLGGGVLPQAPEYGQAQPGPHTAARLRYGMGLARQSGLPVAFSGGLGWAAHGAQQESEAEVAARVARQDYGVTLRWSEAQSRDTSGNARLLAPLLQHDGIQRIALVTDASHMPRAVAAFERAGLTVTPAPTGYTLPVQQELLEWLPSAHGLLATQLVLHEWLGLAAGRFLPV